MYSGAENLSEKGYILEIDGTETFGAWKEDSKCDSLVGLQEPSVFPPISSTQIFQDNGTYNTKEVKAENDIDLFVGIMCRSIPLKAVAKDIMSNVTSTNFTKHIKPVRYEPASYVFDPTSNEEACFYNDVDNQNLPKGVLGIQTCKFGTPFAVSFPHFLHADKW